jgi:hypothetical protein
MYDYNSTRPKLILSEYGRNVQNMVKHVTTLPTKEERNRYAQVVIEMMGHLNPHLRDVTDFRHKLWDHLFVISDFKLDVDSPYPIPSAETLESKPERLPYPYLNIRFKHYGKAVELLIEQAKKMDNGDKKQELVLQIANFMKMAYVTWNKDNVNDDIIIKDLDRLSNGLLSLEPNITLNKFEARQAPNAVKRQGSNYQNKNKNKNNRNRNQGKRK